MLRWHAVTRTLSSIWLKTTPKVRSLAAGVRFARWRVRQLGMLLRIAQRGAASRFEHLVGDWSPSTSYRVLQDSQNLFEPDEGATEPSKVVRAARTPRRRTWITPLGNLRVAARQKRHRASCKGWLEETYDLDHVKSLFRGGSNDEGHLHA